MARKSARHRMFEVMPTSNPTLGPRMLGLVALAVLWLVPSLASAQHAGLLGRVVGRIVDDSTGQVLSDATLEVANSDIAGPASRDGRFMLPLMVPGAIEITLSHPGYEPRVERVNVLAGQTVDVRVGLAPSPLYELEPIDVVVRSRVLEARGFYERQQQGYSGVFYTRQDIHDRDPHNVTELFTNLPGARVLAGGLSGPQIVFQRATNVRNSGVCQPSLFLDGIKSQIRLYDMILDPTHIEGLEVYVGAGIPGRFNDPCGAVLVWTR